MPAVTERQRVVADHPAVSAYRAELAQSHATLANLYAALGRRPEAVAAYRDAIALRAKLVADHPDVSAYREKLDASSLALAVTLIAEGQVAEAMDTATRVAAGPAPTAAVLYDCACAFAQAAVSTPSEADMRPARAVALLRRAFAAGYRDVPHMLQDADLAALRGRDDYAALLWDLADLPA